MDEVYQDEDEVAPWSDEDRMPLQLDTSQPYPDSISHAAQGDYLGGLKWSAAWMAYIGPLVPVRVADVKRLRREWWSDQRLIDKLAHHLGVDTMAALVAWQRDDVDYNAANRWTVAGRRNPGWLEMQHRRAKRMVRLFLPPNLPVDQLDAALADDDEDN